MGHIDPVDIIANVATGGLYGAGQSAVDVATGKQDVLGGLQSGLNSLGPFGSVANPISPQVAQAGNLAGLGAGIGGGLASGQGIGGGGFGAAQSPYYAGIGPEGLPMLADPSTGFVAQNVVIDPVTGAATPGSGITAGGIGGLSAGTAGGFGGTGALAGSQAAQQLSGLLGGASPLSLPSGGGGGFPGSGQLTPQQLAALSAMQSEAHRGLAPSFEARMRGKPTDPGIAGTNFSQ